MRKCTWSAVGIGLCLGLALVTTLQAAIITGSRHDLSTATTDQVCIFCHTPHNANTLVAAPLWNRFVDMNRTYTLYSSTTMNSLPGQPHNTVSQVCLGCHDGTVGESSLSGTASEGRTGNVSHDLVDPESPDGYPDSTSYSNCERCHTDIYSDGTRVLLVGPDLSDDHPISMTYPTPAQDPEFNIPPNLTNGWSDVKLFGGMVECASCHKVHDPGIEPFLRISNSGSQLCTTCHTK